MNEGPNLDSSRFLSISNTYTSSPLTSKYKNLQFPKLDVIEKVTNPNRNIQFRWYMKQCDSKGLWDELDINYYFKYVILKGSNKLNEKAKQTLWILHKDVPRIFFLNKQLDFHFHFSSRPEWCLIGNFAGKSSTQNISIIYRRNSFRVIKMTKNEKKYEKRAFNERRKLVNTWATFSHTASMSRTIFPLMR